MKRLYNILLAFSIISINACQTEAVKEEIKSEPQDPQAVDQGLWSTVEGGLNSGFGTTDTRYSRSLPPGDSLYREVAITGWRGEKVHCQLLLWSVTDEGIINIGPDRKVNTSIINDEHINIRTVKYVLADEFLNGCGYRDKDTIEAYLMPDMLDSTSTFNMPGKETRPVWISISIPPDTEPGNYTIGLKASSIKDTIRHSISLEVLDNKLPPPEEWDFHLDLWQNPFAVARYHNVQLWSQQHMDLMKPLLKMLAEAGQKCITTSITDKPWGGQTYDPFNSMITWIKNTGGFWEYDYSVFDQYVQLAIDCGIDKQINCYSMVPWGNKFTWFDEDSAKFVTVENIPGSEEYMELWTPFLNNFRAHLMEKGWLDKVTIALDERGKEEMKNLFSYLDKTSPDFKVTMAGHFFEDINESIYDFSYNWWHITESTADVIRERKDNDLLTTYYVACGVPKPNTFTFSPPAESCYLGWFAAANGFNGFLRWAYNSWPEDPVYDSRFITWPSGDTYFVYPGARSSVRFERLIEGIQDYEKIRILKQQLANNPSTEAIEAEKRLNKFLDSINVNSLDNVPAKDIIKEGKKLLEELSRGI